MVDFRFRFGVVAGFSDLTGWTELARRVEELGYDTLLSPDPQRNLDPMTTLAAAAAVTTTLHVGTFVAVDKFRDRRMLAWQAHSLNSATGGRFELGLGTGRPDAAARLRALGGEFGTGGQRVEHLAETVAYLKSQPERPPLLLAAGGPRMLALAAREADIVTMAWSPRTPKDRARAVVRQVHEAAAGRPGGIELAMNLLAVGNKPTPWIEQVACVGVPDLVANDAVTVLPGTPRHGADTLRRWRDETGISYITINSGFLEEFASVIELLKGT